MSTRGERVLRAIDAHLWKAVCTVNCLLMLLMMAWTGPGMIAAAAIWLVVGWTAPLLRLLERRRRAFEADVRRSAFAHRSVPTTAELRRPTHLHRPTSRPSGRPRPSRPESLPF